jgi:ABC-type glycerol-3-phosphate transport system permease component
VWDSWLADTGTELTPTLIVFLIFQRQFVSALLQGSLKG